MARKKAAEDHFLMMEGQILMCPLCCHDSVQEYVQDRRRPYFECGNCGLVFVPEAFHLDADQEKAEYDFHQNVSGDEGYRQFLSRAYEPVVKRVPLSAKGLDFGCGPGPVLADMFVEAGYQMQVYDPFYAPDSSVLNQQYDFITCTEVIEHVSQPHDVFPLLITLLADDGVLVVMTKRVRDRAAFANWHYKNDRTHICFYSEQTFRWVAETYDLFVDFIGADVVLFKK